MAGVDVGLAITLIAIGFCFGVVSGGLAVALWGCDHGDFPPRGRA